MNFWFLLVGVVIGIVVAAPIGPVNVICIQKAMRSGVLAAFLVGMGAAVGDALFATVAVFGLTSVADLLISLERWLMLGGAGILLIMGIVTWRAEPHLSDPVPQVADTLRGATATFALTITNPITALGFIAMFTSLGFTRTDTHLDAVTVVLGVLAGSALWWFSVSRLAWGIRGRLDDRHLRLINRGSAVVIWGFALLAFIKALWA